ncbi:unnamed protein product [Auanema sp. JU1783]|nr:unnamed protein product [Auanema sp. JU1783]
MTNASCPYELTNEETVYSGQWLTTRQVQFKAANGVTGVWQSSHRTTKREGALVDGVDIIAFLIKDNKKFIILVKQYRIPMKGWSLEFPAGLIDKGETVEECAIRELKEETGYVISSSDIIHKSGGVQGLDPGLTDDSIQFVTVNVNGDLAENQNPVQKLDSEEAIDVILVETKDLLRYLGSIEKEIHVEAMVYSFAIGCHLS